MAHPNLIFGGAGLGLDHTTAEAVEEILRVLKDNSVRRIDTAGRYPPTQMGRSEELLGETRAGQEGFQVDTKIFIDVGKQGHMRKDKIEASLKTSLQRLGVTQVNTLHIHGPDSETPLEEQAETLDDLYRAGKFKHLGVSNFKPDLLEEYIALCEEHGWVKPTIYQGEYNAVTRGMEKHLLPILRRHGILFNAFRPLAAGFLSGSLTNNQVEGTRFDESAIYSKPLRGIFDNEPMHAAVRSLEAATREIEISTAEASLRWICYHSALGKDDGVIIGARTVEQLRQNLAAVEKGPLPDACVQALESIRGPLESMRGGIL